MEIKRAIRDNSGGRVNFGAGQPFVGECGVYQSTVGNWQVWNPFGVATDPENMFQNALAQGTGLTQRIGDKFTTIRHEFKFKFFAEPGSNNNGGTMYIKLIRNKTRRANTALPNIVEVMDNINNPGAMILYANRDIFQVVKSWQVPIYPNSGAAGAVASAGACQSREIYYSWKPRNRDEALVHMTGATANSSAVEKNGYFFVWYFVDNCEDTANYPRSGPAVPPSAMSFYYWARQFFVG